MPKTAPEETIVQASAALEPPRQPWGWNRRQRIGLGMLLSLLIGLLLVQWWRRPARLDDPDGVVVDGHAVILPQRIDPNTASEEELIRIPHIGPATAKKIIDYRQAHATSGPVFKRIEDLDAIPGIGKTLLEEIKPYVEFPEERNP